MTVCFNFDSEREPWIAQFDRYNVFGHPVSDERISTYDIAGIPDALSNYRGFPWFSDDSRYSEPRKVCDAFYVEMVKLGFYEEVLRPQAQHPQAVWRDTEKWIDFIQKKRGEALGEIDRLKEEEESAKIYHEWECGAFGDCFPGYIESGRQFIQCVADKLTHAADHEEPVMAGVGFPVVEEEGYPLPRIGIPVNESHHTLKKLGFETWYNIYQYYIHSVDGIPAQTLTQEEIQTALSGPEDTMARMEIGRFDWSRGNMCTAEPNAVADVNLRRGLHMGEIMTECGGLDLRLTRP